MSEVCIHGIMAIVDFDSVKGLDIITQDAYILGEILDIRFEDLTWNIQGFKVKSESKVSKMINVGSGKSMLLVHPGKYVINDVVLLPDTIDGLGVKVSADSNDFKSVSSLLGMKVMSKENFLIGTVDSIMVDLDNWNVVSMKVKLDKVAYAPLDIKKGLLSKKVSGLMMTDVAEIGDSINLALDILTIKAQVTVD